MDLANLRIIFVFYTVAPSTALYTLSLHDALPISARLHGALNGGTSNTARAGSLREGELDRKSTRLNSSHITNSYAVFCLKKKTEAARGMHPLGVLPAPARSHLAVSFRAQRCQQRG